MTSELESMQQKIMVLEKQVKELEDFKLKVYRNLGLPSFEVIGIPLLTIERYHKVFKSSYHCSVILKDGHVW